MNNQARRQLSGRLPGQRLDMDEKIYIILQWARGRPAQMIARDLQVSRTSVITRWIARFQQTGGLDCLKSSGRPRILDEMQLIQIAWLIQQNGFLHAIEVLGKFCLLGVGNSLLTAHSSLMAIFGHD